MITLYTGLGSGNAYKAELMMHMLGVPFEPVSIFIPKGEHRAPDFLKLTPFGQIPVLVDGETVLTDSQAILCYLARQYGGDQADHWLPMEPVSLAQVMRWLSVASNEIQNTLTMARAAKLLRWEIDYDNAVKRSYKLLTLMNDHLANRDWLAAEHATIADLACYPYIFLAAEGGVDTRPYDAITAWMRRVEDLPNFLDMPRIPNLPPVELTPPPNV